MSDVTRILSPIEPGDPSAAEQLLPLVYDELRKLAARKLAQEKPGQTLQATALVHEAYLRLVDVETGPALEQPRPLLRRRRRGHAAHPGRAAPAASERPQARRRPAARANCRTPIAVAVPVSDDLLALDEALDALAAADPQGRTGQAPLLRRPDRRGGGRRSWASRADGQARLGLRPGLAATRTGRERRAAGLSLTEIPNLAGIHGPRSR